MHIRISTAIVGALSLALVVPVSFSQDRPSWRPEAPERPELPPDVSQPDFKFEVDRSSLTFSNAAIEPRATTSVSARTAEPELGRVATWRERLLSNDSRRNKAKRQPEPEPADSSEPTEDAEQIASLTPPQPAAPADQPSPIPVPEDYRLKPLKPVRPEYPRDALLDGTEGWVDVEIIVAPDGSVSRTSVVDAEPRRVFEKSALRAAGQWEFEPPRGAGIESPQRGVYRFRFTMEG